MHDGSATATLVLAGYKFCLPESGWNSHVDQIRPGPVRLAHIHTLALPRLFIPHLGALALSVHLFVDSPYRPSNRQDEAIHLDFHLEPGSVRCR